MNVFGICGGKQSGKSSFARFVREVLPNKKVAVLSFAKPLKDFVVKTFRIDPKHCYGSDNDKNYPLCAWSDIFEPKALEKYNKRPTSLLSAREILQVVGTDVMRLDNLDFLHSAFALNCRMFIEEKIHEGAEPYNNIWIDLLIHDVKCNDSDIVVVPDIRFENELEPTSK
jgi:hypothetical protein